MVMPVGRRELLKCVGTAVVAMALPGCRDPSDSGPPDCSEVAVEQVRTTDGRSLAYAEYGAATGTPVFYFHQTPGSRLYRPNEATSSSSGARVISIDRPGYGCSAHLQCRTLLDWPDDVVAVANHLGLERFAVAGISPFVVACAYKIPDRLTRAAIVSGPGPMDAPGARDSMMFSRRAGAFLLPMFPSVAAAAIEIFANPGDDPEGFLELGSAGLPAADHEILENPEIRGMLIESYRESARHGVSGFVRDLYLYTHPWKIPLHAITAEVHLWHGELDPSTPVASARYVADRIPRCHARFLPNEGHFILFRHWEEILETLLA